MPTARLREISNFGDGDSGAGKMHVCARDISRKRIMFNVRTFLKAQLLGDQMFHIVLLEFQAGHIKYDFNQLETL